MRFKCELLIYIGLLLSILCTSCERLEYSPNQKFDNKTPSNINAKNLEKLLKTPGDDTIRFVLCGDSQRAYDDLLPMVKKVNSMKGIDFVVLNGDISDFGLLQEFKWVEDIYSRLNVPRIAVIGNHDHVGNGVEVYKRIYSQDLDFTFTYQGVKFVCHNTNSREYKFNGTVPDLPWLRKQITADENIRGILAIAHVPPTSRDFDDRLFDEYGQILTSSRNVYAVLNAHVDKQSVKYPYTAELPVITTNSIYNRHFLVVEIVGNSFKYHEVSF